MKLCYPFRNKAFPCIPFKLLLTMKFTFLFILVSVMQVSASSFAQSINLNTDNSTLLEALQSIQQQSGYKLLYNTKMLKSAVTVSVSVTNSTVKEALEACFENQTLSFVIDDQTIIVKPLPANTLVQKVEIVVTGKVTDKNDGTSLPGVSVQVVGSKIGTVTDGDGNYKILASGNSILIFSFMGYEKFQVQVAGETSLYNVQLIPESKGLNEVVVVGYGTVKKKDLTGAVSTLDNSKLENLPNTNIVQALRGTIPGVSIDATGRAGSGSAVNIRGQNSISASSNALIVVDGIIFNGSLANLNPNDIATIDVLKDASSAAIYGSRAANGVVLISTRKGKSDQPSIQFNSYAGIQSFLMNEKLENASEYIQKILNYRKTLAYRGVAPAPDLAHPEKYLNADEVSNFLNGTSQEPFDVISRKAPIQNYNLSVGANNGKTNYFFSGTYTDQKGKIIGDQFKRTAVRINLESKITDWLKLGTNSSYAFVDNSGSPASLVQATRLSPYARYYLDSAKTILNPYPMTDNFVSNPLLPTLNSNIVQRNDLFGIFYGELSVPFIKGLSYRVSYANNTTTFKNYSFVPAFNAGGVNNVGSASDGFSQNKDITLQHLLKYNHTFAKDHNIDATLLYEYNSANNTRVTANANTFPTDVLNFYSLSLGANQATFASYSDYHSLGMMARINYKYKDRYLLTVTGRRDGASLFSESNKFAFFPSLALGWVLSDETFLKDNSVIDFLKLRISYGGNGNQAINRYGSLSIISTGSSYNYTYNGSNTAYGVNTTTLGNPNLKWESTYATNVGIDFELLKSRINGSINYYNSNTRDLLLNQRIPTLNGFSSVLSNLGQLNNKGVEISLNAIAVKQKDFNWNMAINFAHNKNKIVSLYGTKDANGNQLDDINNRLFIGKSLGAYYGYEGIGIWQISDIGNAPTGFRPGDVKLKDLNNDGKITPAGDRTILGYDRPNYTFGYNTTISYKQFSLYAQITGSVGGVRNNGGILDPASSLVYRVRGAKIDWWNPDNASAAHPSIDYQSTTYSLPFLQSTTFIRIQDLSLSYSFSNHLLERIKASKFQLYASAKNPFLFTKWQGWDPESSESGQGQFPTMKSFTIGLNIIL